MLWLRIEQTTADSGFNLIICERILDNHKSILEK